MYDVTGANKNLIARPDILEHVARVSVCHCLGSRLSQNFNYY